MTEQERREAMRKYDAIYSTFSCACDAVANYVDYLSRKNGKVNTSPYCRFADAQERKEYNRLRLQLVYAETDADAAAYRLQKQYWEE